MGRSKNRKKRRLGRIHKQAVNVDPWIPRYVFWDRCETRFLTWCGFYKWYYAADTKGVESFDEQDEKELEFVSVPVPDNPDFSRIEFPNDTEYGRLRMYAKELKAYIEFDDSVFKSKHYHSKKTTRYRVREIKKYIDQYRGFVEKQYKKVLETEPEKIEDWIKELMSEKWDEARTEKSGGWAGLVNRLR